MKCGMLIVVATHACAPAPMMTRSDLPLRRSGTRRTIERPPTSRRSMVGEMIDAR